MTNTFEGRETLWVVHIGKDDLIPLRARNEGFVCIGWSKIGDCTPYKNRDAMRAVVAKTWPEWSARKVSASYGQVYRFAHMMKAGDPIVFPIRQTREIAIGCVTGTYRYEAAGQLQDLDYANVQEVKWLKFVPRTTFTKSALHSFGSFSSVSTSNDHLEEVIAILNGEAVTDGKKKPDRGNQHELEDDDEASDLYESASQETEDYLLKAWHNTGIAFEPVVAALLEAMGYTAKVTKGSGDHGVDVIAHPDPLGLKPPFIKIQAKSGTSTIGEPEVSQLIGTLNEGEKGILVSLGGFSSAAKSKARNAANLSLIDEKEFVSLFLAFYEELSPEWRAKYPLARVYVPKA